MIKNLKNSYNIKAMVFVFTAALLSSMGQMFWKLSKDKESFFFLGFALYAAGSYFFILALKSGELSVVQPMMSVGYIFALIIGIAVLNEHVTSGQFFGVALIIVGVSLIGGRDV